MIRFSQKNWIYCSNFARTQTFTGLVSIARHLPVKRSTLVRSKIRSLFGSAWVAPPPHSLAPVCLDSLSWLPSSVANPNDSVLLWTYIARPVAALVTLPRNSWLAFTPSASLETPPSRLPTTFIPDTHTHSPKSARSAAGPPLPGHHQQAGARPLVH